MGSGSYLQVYVGCPFYRKDDGAHRITCEGIVDQSSLILRFQEAKDFKFHAREYCCSRYICCEVYRMLMDKYEE